MGLFGYVLSSYQLAISLAITSLSVRLSSMIDSGYIKEAEVLSFFTVSS